MKHTREELAQWQALPLFVKVRMTQQRIRDWIREYGIDGVYVSFSGGKDSTVLLHIARGLYPDIKAVFCNTGLEYPEIVQFVKTFDNVDWVRPKKNFKQVIQEYGYPFISKEVSESVEGAKKYLTKLMAKNEAQTDRQTDLPYAYSFRRHTGAGEFAKPSGIIEGGTTISTERLEELASTLNRKMHNREGGANQRLAILMGMLTKDGKIEANIPEKDRSQFAQTRWQSLLFCPFDISNKCCNVMKKAPMHAYHKETGRNPITAQMASESKLRTQKWLQHGCNGFDLKIPTSNPMAFWTEQDVLRYIVLRNVQIASVYGEVVPDYEAMDMLPGQYTLSDIIDDKTLTGFQEKIYKTTGVSRTGCMFCGFGVHLEKSPNRFERMKETHPKIYDYVFRSIEEGGLNYKEVIDWLNENADTNIKY